MTYKTNIKRKSNNINADTLKLIAMERTEMQNSY